MISKLLTGESCRNTIELHRTMSCELDEALKQADTQMYQAKAARKVSNAAR